MDTITLALRAEDAEPILRLHAELAARYGAFCDHITRKTVERPNAYTPIEEARAEWLAKFLQAKRVVESFGLEYEPTSEAETLTVYVPDKVLKSRIVKGVAGMSFRLIDKSVPDPKNARPKWRGGVHQEACRHAAERVVRRWRAALAQAAAA